MSKITDATAEDLSDFVSTFFAVLRKPRNYLHHAAEVDRGSGLTIRLIKYAALSLLVGTLLSAVSEGRVTAGFDLKANLVQLVLISTCWFGFSFVAAIALRVVKRGIETTAMMSFIIQNIATCFVVSHFIAVLVGSALWPDSDQIFLVILLYLITHFAFFASLTGIGLVNDNQFGPVGAALIGVVVASLFLLGNLIVFVAGIAVREPGIRLVIS